VSGLWEATAAFMRHRRIDPERVHSWVPGGKQWAQTPMCFATNCFIARVSWFASGTYRDYFDMLDEAGGFYLYRWGDACVHMLGVAALLPAEETLRLHSLPYWHQGVLTDPLQPPPAVLSETCVVRAARVRPSTRAPPALRTRVRALCGRRSCSPPSCRAPRVSYSAGAAYRRLPSDTVRGSEPRGRMESFAPGLDGCKDAQVSPRQSHGPQPTRAPASGLSHVCPQC
jgi:hypothetical protein